ncbi:alpha/beta hydrolase domain-containing protein 11 [Sergentomyia squamirostris]
MALLVKFNPKVLLSNSRNIPSRFVHSVQSVKLSYDEYLPKNLEVAEEASPLLIMHGLFGSRQNWRGISKRLTQVLNPSRRILSIDARNHGQSPHSLEHTYTHMAEDIKDLISNIPKAEKVVLLGHSMGGRCMMYFCLEYPELVESAIIVDISPFSNVHFTGSTDKMSELLRKLKDIPLDPNVAPSAARKMVDQEIRDIMPDQATRDFILLNLYKSEAGFQWRFHIDGLLQNVERSIARFPEEMLQKRFSNPIMFIGGADSQYINPADLPKMREIFPQVELEFVANAGHLVHVQKPNEFLDLVTNFLNR